MKKKRTITAFLAIILALIAISGFQQFNAQAGDAGTIIGVKNVPIVWTPVPITTTTYYYGQFGGTVGQEAWFWHNADAIVTADITGTNTLTITPQFSLDGTNWADGRRLSEGWNLPLVNTTVLTNASGVTNTTTSTATITFASSAAARSSEWVDYTAVLSADGTEVFSFPVQGQYLRFKATTLTTGLSITPTIYLLLRNTGGQ
jgi:hypothetical protein